MAQCVLSINAGSSSLKITLFRPSSKHADIPERIAAANITGLTSPPAKLKYTRAGSKPKSEEARVSNHEEAFEYILDWFEKDQELDDFKGKDDIRYACHRVVHGGDFGRDVLITQDTLHKLEAVAELAPLHNASAIAIIKTCVSRLPNVKNVGCFDSAFHATLPAATRTYMISQDIARKKGLRKYGFHGISYSYILRVTSKFLKKAPESTSLIALHLGSGASACAIKNGKSVDTTMGLTPVSGLPGGTRSGDLDPSLIFHFTSEAASLSRGSTKELHITQAEDILNKQSGWKAIAGTTDFAEIAKPDAIEDVKLAFDIFVDRIVGFIGSYYVKVGGKVDALVFAGGIGEKSDLLRSRVVEAVASLGFSIDEDRNKSPGEETVVDISREASGPRTLVVQTDEEYEMALSCLKNPR